MNLKAGSQPTEVELQILQVLWDQGPSTVRQVHNCLAETKVTLYATTVKMLVVMLGKGLVRRDDSIRPQIYSAAVSQRRTQKSMVNDLVHRAFDGSAKSLVMQALATGKPSAEDLDEIRKLIDEMS